MLRLSPFGRLISPLVFCAACIAAVVSGCTQGTSVTGAGASGIQAHILTLTSIEVTWTRDPMDTSTDTVVVMSGATIVTEVPEPFPHSIHDSALVNGLMSGVLYKIYIATAQGRSGAYNYTLYQSEVPKYVTVISVAGRSASFSWTRDPSDSSADTLIITTLNGELVGDTVIPFGSSIGTFTGLPPGGTYVVIVATKTGRSTPITISIAGAVLNLAVDAISSNSIAVRWSRSLGDSLKFDDTLVVTDVQAGTIVYSHPQSSNSPPASSGIATGLSQGRLYAIAVHSLDTISDTILWMTAQRVFGLHLYEYDDNSGDSTSISFPGAPSSKLILDTSTSQIGSLNLESGLLRNPMDNSVLLSSNVSYILGGLDSDYQNTNYASMIPEINVALYQIPTQTDTQSLIIPSLVLNGSDTNFALIEIVPNDSGHYYSYAADGFRYVTINISYQPTPQQPYAGRGRPPVRTFVRRRSAH